MPIPTDLTSLWLRPVRFLMLLFASLGLAAQSRSTSIEGGMPPIAFGQVQPGSTVTKVVTFRVVNDSRQDIGMDPVYFHIIRTTAVQAGGPTWSFKANGMNVPIAPLGTPTRWPDKWDPNAILPGKMLDYGTKGCFMDVTLEVTFTAGTRAGAVTDTFAMTIQIQGAGGGDVQRKVGVNPLPISAFVANPLTLVNTAPLDFGALTPGATDGTLILTPDSPTGTLSVGVAGPSPLSLAAYPSSAGAFDVTGSAGLSFTITLPVSINLTGPGAPMALDTFTYRCIPAPVGSPPSPVLDASGRATVRVGGTLHVGRDQTAGDYSGTYTLTCNYK